MRWRGEAWAVAAALLVLAGCAGAPGTEAARSGDFAVRGLTVELDTAAPFALQPDLPGRLETTVDAALAYWGGDWSALDGTTLTLTDAAEVPCGGETALGCYDGRRILVTTRDPGVGTFSCVEETVLVHEIGHAIIGDRLHVDPRWMDMERVATALADRRGYSLAGEVPCTIYVSVWQHPPDLP